MGPADGPGRGGRAGGAASNTDNTATDHHNAPASGDAESEADSHDSWSSWESPAGSDDWESDWVHPDEEWTDEEWGEYCAR